MKLSTFFFFALATSQASASLLRRTQQSCPVVPRGTVCPALEAPVECGQGYGCYYSNDCLAQAAGYNIHYCRQSCPVPSRNRCPTHHDPVLCGPEFECEYENECVANAAGFVGCHPINPPSESCAIPTQNRCPTHLDPVLCGSNYDCEYENECVANAAGFVGCIPAW
ncbi:expressed unknown protein [Seminavis robusta]|uniref:Uncharacterized protein n=1 Tax=Seminavis robusta TaxID=568900 RepID=A0A9N8HQ21_9STRA|nr:expressed unknown protein [Seminavis robusta]|eukprot:Sro1150_g246661.1  (167) ;mRNA; f:21543-22043